MKPTKCLVLLPILLILSVSQLTAKETKKMNQMKITSPDFSHGKPIPEQFSCDSTDLSPSLAIEGVPAGAKSLALIMDDPDAPAGVWVHWVIWNIDPSTREIARGSLPPGAELGLNSWKRRSYNGPCPPAGTHRYFFRLYALKERLNLPQSSTRKDLDHAMEGKIIAQSELVGVYSRK